LQANPDHLVSNVQYILRFRNQDKLGGEAGYYISSLMGAVQFIENIDRTSLTISDDEFEKNVEAAVSAIAERHAAEEEKAPPPPPRNPSPHKMHISEKSTISRPEVNPRNSLEAERVVPRRSTSQRHGTRSDASGLVDEDGEKDAVAGLLRTIQKPLNTIGRIFSDDGVTNEKATSSQYPGQSHAPQRALTPQPNTGISPTKPSVPRRSTDDASARARQQQINQQHQQQSAEDSAARQASAEAEEAMKIQRQEHKVVVETLQGMFPGLDRDVIDDVVRQKEGRVGAAVDACLALSNP